MIYLITGENLPLVTEKKQQLLLTHNDVQFETFQNNPSLDMVLNHCQQMDMFSVKKGIIVNNPTWLSTQSKSVINQLNDVLGAAIMHQVVLMIVAKKMDKRNQAFKALKKHGVDAHDCPLFNDWESDKLGDWMHRYCNHHGASIESKAITMLIDFYGSNAALIQQELDKCMVSILPKTRIESRDLHHASSHAIGLYNQLSNALKVGEASDLNTVIQGLLAIKEDPHKIIQQVGFHMNQFIPLAIGLQSNQSPDSIAKKLGKHPYFIKKQLDIARKNPWRQQLSKILGFLSQMDLYYKSGQLTTKQCLLWLTHQLKYQI